jgi:SAM-dependent methyltransferase
MGFLTYAAQQVSDPRSAFVAGTASALPISSDAFDAVVSGLVLNFVPDRGTAIGELRRAARPGAVVAAYVWDYAGGMQLTSRFWAAAEELDPAVRTDAEDVRFGFCRPEPLRAMFRAAGLADVEVDDVVVTTVFRDFDEVWSPFLRGTGPAPAYVGSLDDDRRADLAARFRAALPAGDDGSIRLTARSWTVRGSVC